MYGRLKELRLSILSAAPREETDRQFALLPYNCIKASLIHIHHALRLVAQNCATNSNGTLNMFPIFKKEVVLF